jgi:hypothetical protein
VSQVPKKSAVVQKTRMTIFHTKIRGTNSSVLFSSILVSFAVRESFGLEFSSLKPLKRKHISRPKAYGTTFILPDISKQDVGPSDEAGHANRSTSSSGS